MSLNFLKLRVLLLKEKISEIRTKFSLDSKILKHILSIQYSHCNKLGLGREDDEEEMDYFLKLKERLKWKHSVFFITIIMLSSLLDLPLMNMDISSMNFQLSGPSQEDPLEIQYSF